jgi:hypothetical protein
MRALAQMTMADRWAVNMKQVRLPESAHTSRPWRIHDIASDFRLEDVWALPTPGDSHDFGRLVELLSTLDPAQRSSAPCGCCLRSGGSWESCWGSTATRAAWARG